MIPSSPNSDPSPSSDIIDLVNRIASHPSTEAFSICVLVRDDNPITIAGGQGGRAMSTLSGLVGALLQHMHQNLLVTPSGMVHTLNERPDSNAITALLSKILNAKKKENPSPDPSDE